MLHPVGPLPAAVYWRRRLLLLGLLLALLGGGGWVLVAALSGGSGNDPAGPAAARDVARPSLEQVVPSLAAVDVPTVAPTSEPAPEGVGQPAAPPGPAPGGPCSDDMIAVEVRVPAGEVPAGSKPILDLVVTNVSAVPCARALDKGLQEVVLLDRAGERVWGSNDCFPEASSDTRTLAPGETAVFPVVWGGLTSAPGCTAPRVTPPPGDYVLRGRLDTKTSNDTALTLT